MLDRYNAITGNLATGLHKIRQQYLRKPPVILDLAIRLIVLFAFGGILYLGFYQPAVQARTYDEVVTANAIKEANAGRPFYGFTYANADYGVPILIASTSLIGRAILGPDYLVSDKTVYDILLIFFLLTALACVSPGIPLPLSIGSIVAFLFAFITHRIGFVNGQLWGAMYMILLTGIMTGSAFLPKSNFKHVVSLLAVSILAGYGQFIRQEGTIPAYLGCVALLVTAWGTVLLALLALRDKPGDERITILSTLRHFSWHVTISALVFLGTILIAPFVIRGVYSITLKTPYEQTSVRTHGVGHPLYLSLGYVPNPYNITWKDSNGRVNARLAEATVDLSGEKYNSLLAKEWLKVVTESPWLLTQNILAKTQTVLERFTDIKKNGLAFVVLMTIIPPLILLAVPLIAFYRGAIKVLVVYMGFVGIALGGLATPLLIHPGYVSGLLGGILAIIVLLPMAALTVVTENDHNPSLALALHTSKRVIGWALTVPITGMLIVGAIWGVWTEVRSIQSKAELENVAHTDPDAAIQALEYKYGPYFNEMSSEQQEYAVSVLKRSKNTEIYTRIDRRVPETNAKHSSILVITSKQQLHLILWYDQSYHLSSSANPHSIDNYDILRICANCSENAPKSYADTDHESFLDDFDLPVGIKSQGLQGRYWMTSYPIMLRLKPSTFLITFQHAYFDVNLKWVKTQPDMFRNSLKQLQP